MIQTEGFNLGTRFKDRQSSFVAGFQDQHAGSRATGEPPGSTHDIHGYETDHQEAEQTGELNQFQGQQGSTAGQPGFEGHQLQVRVKLS